MKILFVDLKKSIFSPQFLISILLFLLLFLLSDAPSLSVKNPMSVLDEIVRFRREKWIEGGTSFYSASILYHFDNSLWYSILLPVLSSISALYTFKSEWFSDSYIFSLSRSGYKKFTISKSVASFMTGTLSFLCGILIYAAIVCSIFPSIKDFGENAVSSFDLHMFIDKIINNALLCGICGVSSLLFMLIIKDDFFTICLYVAIEYFSMKCEIKFMNSEKFVERNNKQLLVFFPSRFKDIYWLFPKSIHISFYWYLIIVTMLAVIICVFTYIFIKRRYNYGE